MGIDIKVTASDSAANSRVQATGSIEHLINPTEVQLFGIEDAALKNAVKTYFGEAPTDAYLQNPTPWNNLYTRYGWPQVKVTLRPVSATILGLSSNPVALSNRTLTNTSNVPATFNTDVTDSVSETTETNWTTTHGFEVGQTISYGVEFSGVNIGGETSFSYSSEFGKGGSHSTSVTVSSTSGVTVTLQPNESVVAELSASRGKLRVQIVYEVTLSGDTAINYGGTYKGHHFWALPITAVMSSAGIATSYQTTETLEVGYYTNGRVTTKNISTAGAGV